MPTGRQRRQQRRRHQHKPRHEFCSFEFAQSRSASPFPCCSLRAIYKVNKLTLCFRRRRPALYQQCSRLSPCNWTVQVRPLPPSCTAELTWRSVTFGALCTRPRYLARMHALATLQLRRWS